MSGDSPASRATHRAGPPPSTRQIGGSGDTHDAHSTITTHLRPLGRLRSLARRPGHPYPLQSRVEQVTVDTEHGALPSRLHQQGQVVGRGTYLLYVIFDHGDRLVALRPHLVRVLETRHGR